MKKTVHTLWEYNILFICLSSLSLQHDKGKLDHYFFLGNSVNCLHHEESIDGFFFSWATITQKSAMKQPKRAQKNVT